MPGDKWLDALEVNLERYAQEHDPDDLDDRMGNTLWCALQAIRTLRGRSVTIEYHGGAPELLDAIRDQAMRRIRGLDAP